MNIINYNNSLLLIIDFQEKLVNMLKDSSVKDSAIKAAKAADILDVPVIITEQYPKGLGNTISEIKAAVSSADYLEKTAFSAVKEKDFLNLLEKHNKKQIILFGIETHICILQTAFELMNKGYEVFLIQDASGSRKDSDKDAALRRLIHAGVQIVTTEMVIFELLESSKHPKFKEVQSIIK